MKTLKITALVLSCAFSTAIVSPSFAQNDKKDAKKVADKQNDKKFDNTKMEDDAEWVVKAADAGMFEVQVAALAKTNASSAKVKELAEHMMMDHSKANEELKALAAKKNITLPTRLGDKNQKEFDELTKKKGQDFDEDYAKEMVDGHKDAIDLFKRQADKGKDAELKAWAAGKLPALKHHLEMAQSTKDAVDK